MTADRPDELNERERIQAVGAHGERFDPGLAKAGEERAVGRPGDDRTPAPRTQSDRDREHVLRTAAGLGRHHDLEDRNRRAHGRGPATAARSARRSGRGRTSASAGRSANSAHHGG